MYTLEALIYPYRGRGIIQVTFFLAILVSCMFIPFIGLIIAGIMGLGYGIHIIHAVLNGTQELPAFRILDTFLSGIAPSIVIVVAFISWAFLLFPIFDFVYGQYLNFELAYQHTMVIMGLIVVLFSLLISMAALFYAIEDTWQAYFKPIKAMLIIITHPLKTTIFLVNVISLVLALAAGIYLLNIPIQAIQNPAIPPVIVLFVMVGLVVAAGFFVVGGVCSGFYLIPRWGIALGLNDTRKRKTSGDYA